MKDSEFIEKILELYDSGDGLLPCNKDCDGNKFGELIEDYDSSKESAQDIDWEKYGNVKTQKNRDAKSGNTAPKEEE